MSNKRFKLLSGGFDEEGNPLYLIKDITDMIGDYNICKKVIEQQSKIKELEKDNNGLKERLYDFEKRKIIEESEIDEDVIPKIKLLRIKLYGEKYD